MDPWGTHGNGSDPGHRDDDQDGRRILRWHELWAGQLGEGDRGGA